MQLGFWLIGRRNWTGGYNYLLNLFACAAAAEARFTPVLATGTDVDPDWLVPFREELGVRIVQDVALNADRLMAEQLRAMATGRAPGVLAAFERAACDAAFVPSIVTGSRPGLPVATWLPDFQHRHLPQMFSRQGWWKREISFRLSIAKADAVVVSSEDARRDLERFYPGRASRAAHTHVVPFAIRLRPDHLAADPDAVRRRHGLPETFFYLPNQFWRHKNHITVIEALGRLDDERIVVAASGVPEDLRHPGHFESLAARIRDLGLESRFRILGVIPHAEVVALMRAARAVVNPSLFEGRSTTVEEAKAVGAPLLLSDLPIHREQAPTGAELFAPMDAGALAQALAKLQEKPGPSRPDREAAAAAELPGRIAAFVDGLNRLAEDLASRKR